MRQDNLSRSRSNPSRPHFFRSLLAVCAAALFGGCAAYGVPDQTDAVAESSLTSLPIREVTVFKDGHAFVVHEGELALDAGGAIHLKDLPTPVLGTFWPYVATEGATLHSVVSAKRIVTVQQTALNIPDLIRANIGAKVRIKQSPGEFTGTIVAVPTRLRGEGELDQEVEEIVTEVGQVVMLETEDGYRVIPVSSVQEVIFLDRPADKLAAGTEQHVLTMQVQAEGESTLGQQVRAGMAYVQRGIRWIPNYRVELDGKGQAHVKLQATLINEMTDLQNVTANLVIGVPHFAFKDTIDPLALGRTTAQLSQYFQEGSQTAYAFSNAIQTQVARMGEYRNRAPQAEPPTGDLGPDLGPGDKREDLYIFSVKGVSLKKGQRMVVPVVEFDLPYEDVFTVKLEMSPPPELMRHFNNSQQQQLAQLLHAPKAAHQARLTNSSRYPLTTAPALIMRGGQPLGQAMMTYTSPGAEWTSRSRQRSIFRSRKVTKRWIASRTRPTGAGTTMIGWIWTARSTCITTATSR